MKSFGVQLLPWQIARNKRELLQMFAAADALRNAMVP
jgi:hypothetical protein